MADFHKSLDLTYPDLAQCALYQWRSLLGLPTYLSSLPLAGESASAFHR